MKTSQFTDKKAADISDAVYESDRESIKAKLNELGNTDAKVLLVSADKGDDSSGYFGALILDEKDGKKFLIEAHKGTDDPFTTNPKQLYEVVKDLDDIANIALGNKISEASSAQNFHQRVMEYKREYYSDVPLHGTGHSKGATIAQVLGAISPQDYTSLKVVESPGGTPGIVKQYAGAPNIGVLANKLEIVNGYPTAINSGEQLVKPKVIPIIKDVKDIGNLGNLGSYGYLGYWSIYSLDIHSRTKLIKGLESNEGNAQEWHGEWPKDRKSGYEYFTDSFEVRIDPADLSKSFLLFKETNQVLLEGSTGAKKVGGSYLYNARSIEEASFASGVSKDNIIEGEFNLLNMAGSRTYTIFPEKGNSAESTRTDKAGSCDIRNVNHPSSCIWKGADFTNPYGFISDFSKTSTNKHEFSIYDNKVIDSFISGSYVGLYDLSSYLINPFQQWTTSSFGEDLNSRLESLKHLGFNLNYQLNVKSDYLFQETVREVHADYRYIQQQVYTKYDPIQKNEFDLNHHFMHNSNHQFSTGHWSKQYYATGYGYEYNRPGSSFTLTIGVTFPIAIGLGKEISLVPYEKSSVFFDINDDDYYENVAWVGNTDAILVYDYNDNKVVNSAKKIIFTKWDKTAKSDFEAFKNNFDSNQDNIFDHKDQEFNKFYLWQDLNQDGISQSEELLTLKEKGIASINLDYTTSDKQLQSLGVLNTAIVKWVNGKETTAYDLKLHHSIAGVKYSIIRGSITIKLPEGDFFQVLKADPVDKALDLDLTDFPLYNIILGSTQNDQILTGTAPKIKEEPASGLIIDGGDGDDNISTGNGNDWIKGGHGKDILHSGAGHDVLFIDSEDTNINGGSGFDVAFVTSIMGVSIDLGKASIEAFYGNGGDDTVKAGEKSDDGVQIHGHAGNDDISGSDKDDILVGGSGKDKIRGKHGNDKIFIDAEDDLAAIDAGEGEDSIYVIDNQGITIDMDKVNAEIFVGNNGDDKAFANANKKYIFYGGKGNDELSGGSLSNVLDGGKDNDILRGGNGNNKYMFDVNYGHDTIYAKGKNRGEYKDLVLLTSQLNKKDLIFSQQANNLHLSVKNTDSSLTVSNWFLGDQHKVDGFVYRADDESNNQHLILHEEKAALFLKDGRDWIVYSLLNTDTVIEGGSGSEFFRLGAGNDLIIGWGGHDMVYSGAGNDRVIAWDSLNVEYKGGNVEFYGEEGNDALVGCKGDDILDGGEGNDSLVGREGNDKIFTGNGMDDFANGGEGNDEIHIQGVGKKEAYGGPGNDIFIIEPSDVKERAMYMLGDFDINSKQEKIDFSKMSPLIQSLDPKYLGIWDHSVTIDPSLRNSHGGLIASQEKEGERKVDAAFMCWNLGPGTEDYIRCVILPGVTKEQIMSSPDSFIFE